MTPSNFPSQPSQPKIRKPRMVKPPKPFQNPPQKPKPTYIHFTSLKSLISTYKSQYLTYTTDHFTPQELLDLEDHWNLLVSDCFQEIYERTLKCATCPETHYNKAIEESLENVRTFMEQKPVLEITEDDVEDWEDEIVGLIKLYWEELRREGGCPETWPKPGTLVDGKLVLEEWEERVRVEWMERMFGEGWKDHPLVTGKVDASEEVVEKEMLDVGGDMVVMETVYDEIIGHLAPQAVDQGGEVVMVDFEDDEEEEEEEEEEGIAAKALREMGMQDYEYRGKEIDYGKPGPDEFVRETNEAREERLMREFGVDFAKITKNGKGASRKHVDLTMDSNEGENDDDEMDLELRWN